MALHGIKLVEHSNAGAGSYTTINGLVDASNVKREYPGEDVKNPQGAPYWGGENTRPTIVHTDATANTALRSAWVAGTLKDIRVTWADDSTTVYASVLPVAKKTEVKGALGGVQTFTLELHTFAAS